MSSLARARARKEKKARNKGYARGEKVSSSINRNVYRSYVEQLKAEEIHRKEVIANLWIIFQYTMIERYRFGAQRLTRLRNKTWGEFEAIMAGNVHVREIDQFLRNDVEFSCGLSAVDKNASRWKQIEDQAIREVSAAFLMALLDEFNIKSKGLENICHYAFDLNNKLVAGEISYTDMENRIVKVMSRKIPKKRVLTEVAM
ncbi:hypothetical protein [Selenomonas ruminantium]|uniref:hypothetical protein n=1 Tax=Selenomonas ruminantium TaxID=971 RepID=UPI0015697A6F|nr:hypothetical protein [Selenomonas ruminantium]